MSNPIIIQDTREKMPWNFGFYGYEQRVETVKTGDYTLVGWENSLFIERKRNSGELATNIGKKSKNFYKELDRAKDFEHKYIICEFPEEHIRLFPKHSTIPENRWHKLKISPGYLAHSINVLKDYYGMKVVFAGSAIMAEYTVLQIIDEITRPLDYR